VIEKDDEQTPSWSRAALITHEYTVGGKEEHEHELLETKGMSKFTHPNAEKNAKKRGG